MPNSFFKYLNISSIEERWGMYITTVGYSKIEPNENYPHHERPQSHQFTWNKGRILNDYYMVFTSKGKDIFGSDLSPPAEIDTSTCFFQPGLLINEELFEGDLSPAINSYPYSLP